MTEQTPQIPRPYVGVSGVVDFRQQAEIIAMATGSRVDVCMLGRRVLMGVKVTHKTLINGIANKYGPEWYPVDDDIRYALYRSATDTTSFNVAQVFLDPLDARDTDGYVPLFVSKLLRRADRWIEGIQFDQLPWHLVDYQAFFAHLKGERPDLKILLQASADIMAELRPYQLAARLADYGDTVDYVLFDSSHGTGRSLDARALRPYVGTAHEELLATGIGIAGGLSGENIDTLFGPLLQEFSTLSCDAEGRLHRPAEAADRGLDMLCVREYLEAFARTAHNKL